MLRFLNAPAHALIETRSSAQKPACKDPERNDQGPVITFRAAYVWITMGKLANFLLKRVRRRRNLHIRTSSLIDQSPAN
ncbi:uncharacterized protein LC1917_0681 [Lacticaseibacillus paracasei NRIC 1917]|nr:uncharacterized protein LC1917_0681 [Lacticaseibacillus paracasei NRIC 1917]